MPLPLIHIAIGAAIASALGIGAKKGIDGVSAMKDARRIGEEAEGRHRDGVSRLDDARTHLRTRLEQIDEEKRAVVASTFGRLVEFLERIDQRARMAALESLGTVGVSREHVRQFAAQYLEVGGTVSGALSAVLTGAGASTAATSAVTLLGTTAGGTALTGLSGAALNSALLAWLGGGSLAAGGWGMAAGSVVLGGIAVGPAVLVGGFVLAHQGEKARTKALEYATEVDRAVAQIDAVLGLLRQAERRVDELAIVMRQLDERAARAIDALWQLDGQFDAANDDHIARFAMAMQLAKALSELMRAQVFLESGDLDQQTATILADTRRLLEEPTA